MEDQLRRRARVLSMSMDFQDWRESFANPVSYNPKLYKEMGIEDDFVITFGYRGSSVKIPLVLFCSISSALQTMLLSRPRRGLNVSLKGEPAYPYWWLRSFLEHKTSLPCAEGTAQVMLMARKYGLNAIVRMCRHKLDHCLCIDNFPHVYYAAVEAEDKVLLEQCGHVIAAWSDNLLLLPNLYGLGKKAMLEFLGHPRLCPSAELLVFNAIINWWSNGGRKCYDDLSFLDDLRCCMEKVRFFLLSEQEFKCHVIPSGVFPFEDVQTMLEMMRGQRPRICDFAYYINDPELQATPRCQLLKNVTFSVQLSDVAVLDLKLVGSNAIDDRGIAWFSADKLCHIRRISSPSVLDESGGTLTISNNHGFRAAYKWLRDSCTFEKPLELRPYISYDFVYNGASGRMDEESSVPMKQSKGGVTFEGLLYCTSLSLQFTSTHTESDSESSSDNDQEHSSGPPSSDDLDSIEVIDEAEVKMAMLHLTSV